MSHRLIIELKDNGQIEVSGPIENKVLCYGMLGAAHDAIRDYVANKASGIIAAPHPLLNLQAMKEKR